MARKKEHIWAWVVSRIFDPIFVIPLILFLVTWLALVNGTRIRFLVFLFIVDALLPAAYFVYDLKTKRVKDWDLSRRQDRRGLYAFTAFVHFFAVVLAYFLGKVELAELLFVFWTMAVVFAVITYFWKISIHAGVNAALVAIVNYYFGWSNYWWLLIVLFLIIWARVVIKKHTWAQVLAGAGLALVWMEIGLKLTGSGS